MNSSNLKIANTLQDLWAPSYASDPCTYVSNWHGKRSRIDSLCFRGSATCASSSIKQDHEFLFDDGKEEEYDHIPIYGCFPFAPSGQNGDQIKRKLGYEKHKLTDESCRETFLAKAANLPPVPVHVNNTSHYFTDDHNLYSLLCECFFLTS